MWKPVGTVRIGPATEEVTFGRLTAPLISGHLQLRLRSATGAKMTPLSFGILLPVSVADEGGLPDGRYYPHAEPSIVDLGPGVGEQFDGVLRFRPRAYNLRWLEAGYPVTVWHIDAEVWSAAAVTQPDATFWGFKAGPLTFNLSIGRVGPAGAAPLIRD